MQLVFLTRGFKTHRSDPLVGSKPMGVGPICTLQRQWRLFSVTFRGCSEACRSHNAAITGLRRLKIAGIEWHWKRGKHQLVPGLHGDSTLKRSTWQYGPLLLSGKAFQDGEVGRRLNWAVHSGPKGGSGHRMNRGQHQGLLLNPIHPVRPNNQHESAWFCAS